MFVQRMISLCTPSLKQATGLFKCKMKKNNPSSSIGFQNSTAPCQFDGGTGGQNGKVGVVVLSGDQTLEHEMSTILMPLGVGCFFSRLMMENEVTPESLRSMESKIGDSASLILPELDLNVLAYGCTSASATIGESEVFAQLSTRQTSAAKTTPITAALKAFDVLQTKKIGLVTPYIGEVNEILIKYMEENGPWKVTNLITFNLIKDSDVASVTTESIKEAAIKVGQMEDVDTVFISCTNLRTSQVVSEVEKMIGKPVTSSNLAMAWHIIRLMDIKTDISNMYGALFGK
eukprot:GFUD01011538.1.p1 GENE.GFUD01011538.1~~GFUD01011538.1.p1  ORF type:complete len:289 (-),score=66.84 GFUD01011538.1:65-931(-)